MIQLIYFCTASELTEIDNVVRTLSNIQIRMEDAYTVPCVMLYEVHVKKNCTK